MFELIDRIPSFEEFSEKINQLKDITQQQKRRRKNNNRIYIRGNIVYLPNKGVGAFVGDLHGDFEALSSILYQTDFFNLMETNANLFLIFLGDYGDRGKKIIETIYGVIELKIHYPNNIILLRGNHEEIFIAEEYGTLDEFTNTYGKERGQKLLWQYCEAMSCLPVISITKNGVVGVHGGIPNNDIKSLRALNGPNKNYYAYGIMWNDPDPLISERGPNRRGSRETTFGEVAFDKFMSAINCKLMARAHQWPGEGEELLFNDRLAVVFSNGSSRSVSSRYSKLFDHPTFLMTDLSEVKNKFERSDFVEVLY